MSTEGRIEVLDATGAHAGLYGCLVHIVNFIALAQSCKSGDAPSHGGSAQTDLAGDRRALPITRLARDGDPGAAPPAQCAAKETAKANRLHNFRSARFCQPLAIALPSSNGQTEGQITKLGYAWGRTTGVPCANLDFSDRAEAYLKSYRDRLNPQTQMRVMK
jgi:hypothetical protein